MMISLMQRLAVMSLPAAISLPETMAMANTVTVALQVGAIVYTGISALQTAIMITILAFQAVAMRVFDF